MEKTVEFNNIRELGDSDIWDYPPDNKTIEKILTHYDESKKKYVTKITYGKKA